MLKKKLEIAFRQTGETKNNYTFEQERAEGSQVVMFPNKIYLNKMVFSKKPARISLTIS